MNQSMTLKDGKFWQDGKVVPMEHGNKEQIDLLNRVQNLTYPGVLLKGFVKNQDDEFNSILQFNHVCLCGEKTQLEYTYKEVVSIDEKIKCTSCNAIYTLEPFDYSDSFLVIKLAPKKVKS